MGFTDYTNHIVSFIATAESSSNQYQHPEPQIMYNQSERKCTYLNKESLNPKLYPGGYTKKQKYPLPCGKTSGMEGTSPFLTTAELPELFIPADGPAPGTYHNAEMISAVKTSKVPVFKETDKNRFPDTVMIDVAPNAYKIPTTLGKPIPNAQIPSHKVYVQVLDKAPMRDELEQGDQKLKWKLKKTSPSIPYPEKGFTTEAASAAHVVLQETKSGEGTVSLSQHADKGYSFPKSAAGIRYQIIDSPGPNYYDSVDAEKKLVGKESTYGRDSMSHGTYERVMGQILDYEIKRDIPGPGRYNISRNIKSNCGSTFSKAPRIPMEAESPGPQDYAAYHEWDTGVNAKSDYPEPTVRFSKPHEQKHPDPCAYDLNEKHSLFSDVMKRASESRANMKYANKRFDYSQKTPLTPAPGAYTGSVVTPIPKGQKVNRSAFNSSEEKFADKLRLKTPAPADYYTELSSEKVHSRGKIVKNLAVGQRFSKTAIPKTPASNIYVIGNIEYDSRKQFNSMFASSVPRFVEKVKHDVPDPGTYKVETAIVKTSFNITLG